VSDYLVFMSIGIATVAFIASILVYVRRAKERMRHSLLRLERIRDKLEG